MSIYGFPDTAYQDPNYYQFGVGTPPINPNTSPDSSYGFSDFFGGVGETLGDIIDIFGNSWARDQTGTTTAPTNTAGGTVGTGGGLGGFDTNQLILYGGVGLLALLLVTR